MAPAIRGTANAAVATASNVSTPTNLVPTLPTHVAGDLLLCYSACSKPTAAVATPSGWTSLAAVVPTAGRMALFGKVAASGSETNPTVTWSSLTTGNSGSPAQAQCVVFTGMQATITGIVDVTGSTEDDLGTAGSNASGASITTLTTDDLVLSLALNGDDAGTWTAPSGFTMIGATGTTSGLDQGFAWAYMVQNTPGSVSPADYSLAGDIGGAIGSGVLIALKAAASAAAPGPSPGVLKPPLRRRASRYLTFR